MGIFVNVLKSSFGDCTLNGVSSTNNSFVVVNTEGPFVEGKNGLGLYLDVGPLNTIRLITAREKETGERAMFGGNFAHTSDARFSRAIEEMLGHRFYGAVAIHDRFEV